MKLIAIILAIGLLSTLHCATGDEPSPLLQVKTLKLDSALKIAQEAVKQSHANGATNVGVCIVDYAGRVLVLLRDDNATEHTVLGSEQKAWTAANYHDSTRRLLDRIKKAGIQQIAIIPYSPPGGSREETIRGFAKAMS